MSADHYFNLCTKNIGVPVEIRCHDGSTHRGIIDRVEHERVFLRPLDNQVGNSQGLFFWGFGWGLAAGIALGSIATLVFLPWYGW